MPSIQYPKQQPEYDSSRRSQVVGVAPAQIYSVAWLNAEGRRSLCLAIVFGKDTEDGGPGVFIMADEDQMNEQLKLATSVVKQGVRQWLASQNPDADTDVPSQLGHIDLGRVELREDAADEQDFIK
jgi:hypothetical protein